MYRLYIRSLYCLLARVNTGLPLQVAVFILLFENPCLVKAQIFSGIEKYNTDSLEQLIPLRYENELADIYTKLAISFAYYNPPKCGFYANKALELSRELDYTKGLGDANRSAGLMHMYSGRYPDAVTYFYTALNLYEDAKDDYALAHLYYDLAKVHFYAGNYPKSEEYGMETLELFQAKKTDGTTVGTLWDIAKSKSGFGLLLRTTNRSEKAKEIYLWYYRIMNEEGYEITNRMVHTQLLGRCYDETNKPDSALWYFEKTLEFAEVNPSIKALKMESRFSMAVILFKQGKHREAEKYFLLVADEMGKDGFLRQATHSNIMLGDMQMKLDNYSNAEVYYLKALDYSQEMIENQSLYRYDSLNYVVSNGAELFFPYPQSFTRTTIWKFRSSITGKLFELYRSKGKYKPATEYMVLHSQAKDSLHALGSIRDLLEMQTKYETSRKELQIQQLAEANRNQQLRLDQSWIIMAGMGLLIMLLLIIGVLWIRQGRIKTRQQMIILEQKLLRSQMNPHFIFNSLASIQDFILSRDPNSASRYLSRFARLIRNILDCSLEEMIPVSREIETIDNYLHLQKVRMENKFDFEIRVDESLNREETMLPAMLVQPFVENAIDHGIRFKPDKGNIDVHFKMNGKWLDISVEDNGVGRIKSHELEGNSKKDHASVSTGLIHERLRILNKKSIRKISLVIIDLYTNNKEASGTRVEIRIPV
ncbi:MAG: histidine kinase [Lentimicrobium sp.]